MTKKELQKHLETNIWETSDDGKIHGYSAAVVVAALYKKIYGEFPKIGLSGSQGEAAEAVFRELP